MVRVLLLLVLPIMTMDLAYHGGTFLHIILIMVRIMVIVVLLLLMIMLMITIVKKTSSGRMMVRKVH